MNKKSFLRSGWILILAAGFNIPLYAQTSANAPVPADPISGLLIFLFILILTALFAAILLYRKTKKISMTLRRRKKESDVSRFIEYINTMDSKQIESYLQFKDHKSSGKNITKDLKSGILGLLVFTGITFSSLPASAEPSKQYGWLFSEGGIIITLVLILIPVLGGIVLMIVKIRRILQQLQNKQNLEEADKLAKYLEQDDQDEIGKALLKRKHALDFALTHNELSGEISAEDTKGLLASVSSNAALPVVSSKQRASKRPSIDPALSKLILWFIGTASFWLVFGTTVGEYIGIKFVAPDLDQVSWLSFGRLRPVHTNSVFWGWASLGMLSLGYYIVPRVSNAPLASIKTGWWALWLINASVIIGTILLMAGVNNGGGEFREYIWPVQLLFAIALVITLINFLQTVANRTTKEIYISNWYMISSIIFAIVITIVAYVPLWQDGLGETIAQGYYMHQGVGMWFMFFTLGIVYYFLPQQLNKPIYSYSLGILAFWTQILFYTVIGTHHFVFSSIPWSLQTVAIVGSVGMIIPVAAGTANFILTFNGAWHKVPSSYTLPFFLVGIIFYFTGSMQGTAEAFRSTNLIWHFTDFTVAHSHLTMYGIICFFLWAGIYALVPRLTGKEAPQITVGAHFWLALIGLMFYSIPLMVGGTLKGLMWIDGKPFIDSVVFMAPYWLWRAIGGSLMWLSHLFFAYNLYKMLTGSNTVDIREAAIEKLNQSYSDTDPKY